MLDIYDYDNAGEDGNYPWMTLCKCLTQLCYVTYKTFKPFME